MYFHYMLNYVIKISQEFHYIMKCTALSALCRKITDKKYCTCINNFITCTYTYKFEFLMSLTLAQMLFH